jgi:hypothetical protein
VSIPQSNLLSREIFTFLKIFFARSQILERKRFAELSANAPRCCTLLSGGLFYEFSAPLFILSPADSCSCVANRDFSANAELFARRAAGALAKQKSSGLKA